MKLARHAGLLDVPGSAPHKTHASPTPLAGGLILCICVPAAAIGIGAWRDPSLRALLTAAPIIFLLGLWDDARGVNAWIKLLVQALAAVALIAGGVSVSFSQALHLLPSPFSAWADVALTILWVIGITNAENLVDSMDGLALGLTVISLLFFVPLSALARQPQLGIFGAVMLGVCIGLYIFNRAPAQFFLGDSGAQTLGFLLAGIALIYVPPGRPQASSWFLPIMLLGLPILDTVSVSTAGSVDGSRS